MRTFLFSVVDSVTSLTPARFTWELARSPAQDPLWFSLPFAVNRHIGSLVGEQEAAQRSAGVSGLSGVSRVFVLRGVMPAGVRRVCLCGHCEQGLSLTRTSPMGLAGVRGPYR